eukprot:271630_1
MASYDRGVPGSNRSVGEWQGHDDTGLPETRYASSPFHHQTPSAQNYLQNTTASAAKIKSPQDTGKGAKKGKSTGPFDPQKILARRSGRQRPAPVQTKPDAAAQAPISPTASRA